MEKLKKEQKEGTEEKASTLFIVSLSKRHDRGNTLSLLSWPLEFMGPGTPATGCGEQGSELCRGS